MPAFWGFLALLGIDAAKGGWRIGLEGHTPGAGETTATPGAGDPMNQYFDKGGGIKELWDHFKPGGTYWRGEQRGQMGASGSYGSGASGSWDGTGTNPELERRFNKMLAEAPEAVRNAVTVNSARRTYEEQARLYQKYGPGRAAPPGRSPHEIGEALDLHIEGPEAQAWLQQHAKEYGLTAPLANEPWHWERAERRGINPNWEDQATRLRDQQSMLFGPTPLGAVGGGTSASFETKTSIVINGSTDPAGTAAALGGAQSRVATELIRNSQSLFV